MHSFQYKSKVTKAAFTLVELLLVMAIIGVLSGLALVVVNEAQHDSRVSSTRSRLAMLDQILKQRFENFQEMRLPIDLSGVTGSNRREARIFKQRVIADMIDVELPRSYFDVAFREADPNNIQNFTFPSREFTQLLVDAGYQSQVIQLARAAPSNARRFAFAGDPDSDPANYPEGQLVDGVWLSSLPFNAGFPETFPTAAQQATLSEYLYAFLGSTEFNGISALEAMGEQAFGDTDGDGYLEVVDPWGNPIFFQFEMYTENGIMIQDIALTAAYGGIPIPADLNAGINFDAATPTIDPPDPTSLDVGNLLIRLVSTGNSVEVISN